MNPPGRCRVNIFGYIPPPCAAPPARRHPSGFAGVSFATVSGLVVGWLAVVEVVDLGVVECVGHTSVRCRGRNCWPRCGLSWWPWPVSMVWVTWVFDDVGVPAGRGLGRPGGRRCGRWCVPQECSMVWCVRWSWYRTIRWPLLLSMVWASLVFERVRCRERARWLWYRSSWWPSLVSMVCSTNVFDDVGVTAGRGLGCRVTCPRPLPWRYPSGFAGISRATVLGLGVR